MKKSRSLLPWCCRSLKTFVNMSGGDFRRRNNEPAELESQLILRVPEDVAQKIRAVINDPSLEKKMNIKIENDLRKAKVRFDGELLHGKVVDLPTVTESLKTIDKKNFYKTADIVQMIVCQKGEEPPVEEDDKPRRKDPNKVDKKFLWPHGLTPPLKNVRKRRFRKTLRKKYHDAPEVEKEVKRLLRNDLDAVNVKYEILAEEEEVKTKRPPTTPKVGLSSAVPSSADLSFEDSSSRIEALDNEDSSSNMIKSEIGEHDIFGEALSDSDDEPGPSGAAGPPGSTLTDDDSRTSLDDSFSMSRMMKEETNSPTPSTPPKGRLSFEGLSSPSKSSPISRPVSSPKDRRALVDRIEQLERELTDLAIKRRSQERNLALVENTALRQRFQALLDSITDEEHAKEMELSDLKRRLELL